MDRAPAVGAWQDPAVRALLRRGLFLALLVPLAGWEPLWRDDPDVAAGNRAYAERRYADALPASERARKGGVEAAGLEYDLGTAKLAWAEGEGQTPAERERLRAEAMDHLGKAATTARDPSIRGKAHYNRGNLLMKQQQLEPAIEAYKDALRADPRLESARVNLELALRQREREEQQRQQQRARRREQQQAGAGLR